jgi:hypothetical protein
MSRKYDENSFSVIVHYFQKLTLLNVVNLCEMFENFWNLFNEWKWDWMKKLNNEWKWKKLINRWCELDERGKEEFKKVEKVDQWMQMK